jgi:hypothetical protein
MSKDKRRGNREVKKPKIVKAREPVVSSFAASMAKAKLGPNSTGKK